MENRNLSRFWKGLRVWATLGRRPASVILAILAGASLLATPVQAQTYVPPGPGQDWDARKSTTELGHDAENTDPSARRMYDPLGSTTLVREQAEQNTDTVAQNVEAKLWPAFYGGWYDYEGLSPCGGEEITFNISYLVQVIGSWFSQWFSSLRCAYSQFTLFSQSDPNFVSQWNSGKTLVMED
ncbi:MAG: hypothetical protein JNN26_01540 [Candidatus Obscuribacter sp.]|nr:hypothetical protein [Candidatus Obscuribacter sp.]